MLKQRTIILNPDEILVIKSRRDEQHTPLCCPATTVEVLAVRTICDNLGQLHVLSASRAFAQHHVDPRQDEIPSILEGKTDKTI